MFATRLDQSWTFSANKYTGMLYKWQHCCCDCSQSSPRAVTFHAFLVTRPARFRWIHARLACFLYLATAILKAGQGNFAIIGGERKSGRQVYI